MDREQSVKRVGLFCFYDHQGIVSEDVLYLLDELRRNLSYLAIIVNGEVKDPEELKKYADTMICRTNTGFDAGAYKYALQDECIFTEIENSDELILCNDTFFGPFIPFRDIFVQMESDDCDFWGLNLSVSGFEDFLQSYFLVFRSTVLRSGAVYSFFDNNISEDTDDIGQVLFMFERDLMRFMQERGFRKGSFSAQRHHIFREPDGSVILDRLPLLKKKALQENYYDEGKIIPTLRWIYENTKYPVDLILSWMVQHCNRIISMEFISKYPSVPYTDDKKPVVDRCVKIHDICDFIHESSSVYIYGTGRIAKEIVELIDRYYPAWKEKVSGFVISDEATCDYSEFADCRILHLSEVSDRESSDLLLALGRKNTEEVLKTTEKFRRVMGLWK